MYSRSLCVSKVKCVCLGRVLCAFDFLQHYAASRQHGGSRQECNLSRSHTHMHTQKRTRPRFYEITNTPPDAQTMCAYQQSLCSSACTRMNKPFFVQLWDQIRS